MKRSRYRASIFYKADGTIIWAKWWALKIFQDHLLKWPQCHAKIIGIQTKLLSRSLIRPIVSEKNISATIICRSTITLFLSSSHAGAFIVNVVGYNSSPQIWFLLFTTTPFRTTIWKPDLNLKILDGSSKMNTLFILWSVAVHSCYDPEQCVHDLKCAAGESYLHDLLICSDVKLVPTRPQFASHIASEKGPDDSLDSGWVVHESGISRPKTSPHLSEEWTEKQKAGMWDWE